MLLLQVFRLKYLPSVRQKFSEWTVVVVQGICGVCYTSVPKEVKCCFMHLLLMVSLCSLRARCTHGVPFFCIYLHFFNHVSGLFGKYVYHSVQLLKQWSLHKVNWKILMTKKVCNLKMKNSKPLKKLSPPNAMQIFFENYFPLVE